MTRSEFDRIGDALCEALDHNEQAYVAIVLEKGVDGKPPPPVWITTSIDPDKLHFVFDMLASSMSNKPHNLKPHYDA